MNLAQLLATKATTLPAIESALNACAPATRREAALSLNRDQQRQLYQKAATAAPLILTDVVPEGTAPLHAVRHFGRNTLPLPRKIQFFEKRFCRPEHEFDRLFGYNEWPPMTNLVGPGYFVALTTLDNHAWQQRGGIVVDYFQVPNGPVAAGWPRVVPNTQGLQTFIFNRTRDFMRRVSTHVTIGAAYRGEKPLDHYFVLVREA